MNKKGFTLVEILVSIGLLALLGSVIAISLNRVFKNKTYGRGGIKWSVGLV